MTKPWFLAGSLLAFAVLTAVLSLPLWWLALAFVDVSWWSVFSITFSALVFVWVVSV